MLNKSGNKGLFGALTDSKARQESVTSSRKRSATLLEKREGTLQKLASGEVVNKAHYWVDPAICRMWPEHDRDYALLNEHNCDDLINRFIQQGKQEFPAIVRRLESDSNYTYEVICGARRHWVVNYLRNEKNRTEYKFLIEIRNLSDEEAFRLSDIENRDREDISDYERAVKYLKALGKYYKTQKQMAERLEVSEEWLSQYLTLAKLPREVVEAYPSVTTIKVGHGRTLVPLLRDTKARAKIVKEAAKISQEQAARRADEKSLIDSVAVFKRLCNAIKARKKPSGPLASYTTPEGKDMLVIDKKGKKALSMQVMLDCGASRGDLSRAFQQALDDYFDQ